MSTEFKPNWTSSPGDTIKDILAARDISDFDFAKRMQFSIEDSLDLIEGRTALTLAIARQLSSILGASVEFWMTRDLQYRQDIARINISDEKWVNQFPIEDMIKFGWIPFVKSLAEKVKVLLNFFDVPNIRTWNERNANIMQGVAFRKSKAYESRPASVAAWIRQGEIQAREISCLPWDREKFKELIPEIRALTLQKDPQVFIPKLQELCATCGVAIVIARSPKGCPANGATKFLSHNKALLLLSFRYKQEDIFWFSFFHEVGHLILHGEDNLFLEGDDTVKTIQEEEANKFAENALIPDEYKKELLALGEDMRKILRFASKLGISRGIVVGQLHHFECIPYNHLTNLINRYTWNN